MTDLRLLLPDGNKEMCSFFSDGNTRNYEFRRQQLQNLHRLILEHEGEIIRALAADFGKPTAETYASEIAFLIPRDQPYP